MISTIGRLALALLLTLSLLGCSGSRPDDLGLIDGRLGPCPSSPNCVASDAADADHQVEPLRYQGDPAGVWTALTSVLTDLPRTTIVTSDDQYLHAEVSSRLFGFVDDVEFHLRPGEGLIAVRSASRIGYSDMGVNAERIETIRQALNAR